MRCARAMPKYQLMLAVGSLGAPVATPLLGGLPEKIERPHPSPHVGHPINHHVAGPMSVDPGWAPARATWTPIRSREASYDLNCNVFTSSRPARVRRGSSSASRSFVLAALRALHLDPDSGPPPKRTWPERGQTTKTTWIHTLRGSPTQISGPLTSCDASCLMRDTCDVI